MINDLYKVSLWFHCNLHGDTRGTSRVGLDKQAFNVQTGTPDSAQWHELQSSRQVVPGVQVSVQKQ
jgi:hypothetical protein